MWSHRGIRSLLATGQSPFVGDFGKNLTTSNLCLKNFPEAKLKSNGLTSFLKEISRQHHIQAVVGLVFTTLIEACNEKSKPKDW